MSRTRSSLKISPPVVISCVRTSGPSGGRPSSAIAELDVVPVGLEQPRGHVGERRGTIGIHGSRQASRPAKQEQGPEAGIVIRMLVREEHGAKVPDGSFASASCLATPSPQSTRYMRSPTTMACAGAARRALGSGLRTELRGQLDRFVAGAIIVRLRGGTPIRQR